MHSDFLSQLTINVTGYENITVLINFIVNDHTTMWEISWVGIDPNNVNVTESIVNTVSAIPDVARLLNQKYLPRR